MALKPHALGVRPLPSGIDRHMQPPAILPGGGGGGGDGGGAVARGDGGGGGREADARQAAEEWRDALRLWRANVGLQCGLLVARFLMMGTVNQLSPLPLVMLVVRVVIHRMEDAERAYRLFQFGFFAETWGSILIAVIADIMGHQTSCESSLSPLTAHFRCSPWSQVTNPNPPQPRPQPYPSPLP